MESKKYDHIELTKEQAFKQLYIPIQKFFRQQLHVCEQEIEDLTMDVLVELINDHWDALETHTLKGLRVWVWNAAHYKALDFIKKKNRQPLVVSIEAAMQEDPDLQYENFSNPLKATDENEEYKQKIAIVKRLLTPPDFQLFDMRLRGHSPPEIAKALGISEGAERTRFCRIRKLLQKELKKQLK